ncbi:cupin domain-containing protein [Oleiagrimonas sp. MCCC 1A03011]|uniref:cupin domain-containing protein n=1 Tax=Oleiagrimonas sp. MCCC 1A03011 TaxID=1926883 RepID=UPI000DC3DD27|nr:cupin domain-containing protein [Oleiagrimonas sp. MCCC 1A03011]RAP56422.1 cupin [Oleiagrimonas sp. MCCC 1A03011]
MSSPILNLDEVQLRGLDASDGPSPDVPPGYDVRWGEIASRIGARKLGYNLTVVAPGKRNCPFHSHRSEEEMFFVLEGRGELRMGEDRYPLRQGDLVACPPGGPETAHQIINTGDTELRYLAVSTMAEVEVCEYPDSGKFGAFAGGEARFRHIGRATDARDYWEGE